MRLLCNGVVLDLESGATMTFKKVNPLFAFDKTTCERTQSFKIPATPTNDRVLALARVPAYDGRGMRRRFDAEYQDGVVVKRGYLYVDKWDGKTYNAIFVTGELIGLQRIKDAGAICDFLVTDKHTEWGNPISASDAFSDAPTWQSVKYQETFAGGIPFPSYSLTRVMNECFDQLGLPRPEYPSAGITQSHIRVIPESVRGIDTKLKLTSVPKVNGAYGDYINDMIDFPRQYFDEASFELSNGMSGMCVRFDGYDQDDRPVIVRYLEVDEHATATDMRRIRGYRARYDCDIVFDENSPELALFTLDTLAHPEDIGQAWQSIEPQWSWFVGSRMWPGSALTTAISRNGNILTYDLVRPVGEPIRGRTFHLNAGSRFALIDLNDLVSEQAYQWTYNTRRTATFEFQYDGGKDYFADGQKEYDVTVGISTAKPIPGDDILLQSNLPSFTLVDACKIWASLSGTVLNYDDNAGVIFDPLVRSDLWPTVDITGKVLSVSRVNRTFADYARHNTISFDSAAETFSYERLVVDYEVDNDNIREERKLYEAPLSEGGIGSDPTATLTPVLIRNANEQETNKATISAAFDGDEFLGRVRLSKNAFIARLCDQSTMIEVRVRMSAYEHSLITPKTKILLDGTLYIWTESDWSKDVVRLLLAKM